MKRVLEVNVDDVGMGGVYSLVRNVIIHTPDIQFDIACIIPFENQSHVDELKSYGCNVYCVGNGAKIWNRWNTYYKNTKKLLEEHQYDCVHIHSDVAYLLYYFSKAAKDAGVKKIIIHSHAAGIDGNHRQLKMALHKAYRNKLRSTANVFLSCSDLASEWMFTGIPSSQITIINNGIDLSKYQFNQSVRNMVRKDIGVSDETIVGHVGRFAYQKNHKYLLDVFKRYLLINSNSKLLLVGEGILKDEIIAYAKQLAIKDKVIFYGPSTEVNKLYQAMDIFLLPSHFEGLPIVGVEAQACGLPCIFSDRITKQADITGNTCFLPINDENSQEWAKKMNLLVSEKIDRSFVAESLRKKKFDLATTIQQLQTIYEN